MSSEEILNRASEINAEVKLLNELASYIASATYLEHYHKMRLIDKMKIDIQCKSEELQKLNDRITYLSQENLVT